MDREGKRESLASRRKYSREYTTSRRQDFRDNVEAIAAAMESADQAGDLKKMNSLRKKMPGCGGRGGGVQGSPTHDSDGDRFRSIDGILEWRHSNMLDHWKSS
eukprot:SAG11_NODE_1604_length_4596_cov_22.286636_2_plen_103_part_00